MRRLYYHCAYYMNDFVELLLFKSLFLSFPISTLFIFSTEFSIISIQLICVRLIKLGLLCSQCVCLCCYFSVLFQLDFIICSGFVCMHRSFLVSRAWFSCILQYIKWIRPNTNEFLYANRVTPFFSQIQTHNNAYIFSENICAVD